MPEQAEWTDSTQYIRHAVVSLGAGYPTSKPLAPMYSASNYDIRTLGERVAALEDKVAHLECIVHRYINANEGTP